MTGDYKIRSLEELTQIYGSPRRVSLIKEVNRITPEYRAWIEASPFAVLASSGATGLDCSPRGDAPGFVQIADDKTLLMPDRPGNNRIDTLRNVIEDPRVALLFVVPGLNACVRVNGRAEISIDPDLLARFSIDGKLPRTVLIVAVDSVYFQCARALTRAKLWDAAGHRDASALPTAGQILAGVETGFDDTAYDAELPDRIQKTLY
ncbi:MULTISPECIES: pyridoxamine 5'-phosphate oxidase family protein [Filomicrobium]|uniref:Pyridoxamine 5'-phosphate oxidase N-terminal domain-containing protein n=1 Tax=Filomicrobium insigne TaxID=418854 RepID=A0A1H0HWI4_9HYPH|nr:MULTISPECIES: pyridoxamine 5'-phosphate oxidase family protein [Filomicrobium]SDO23539.1 hypothetical protein SAMN04488061_0647 [Filomicrobium insigne]